MPNLSVVFPRTHLSAYLYCQCGGTVLLGEAIVDTDQPFKYFHARCIPGGKSVKRPEGEEWNPEDVG